MANAVLNDDQKNFLLRRAPKGSEVYGRTVGGSVWGFAIGEDGVYYAIRPLDDDFHVYADQAVADAADVQVRASWTPVRVNA